MSAPHRPATEAARTARPHLAWPSDDSQTPSDEHRQQPQWRSSSRPRTARPPGTAHVYDRSAQPPSQHYAQPSPRSHGADDAARPIRPRDRVSAQGSAIETACGPAPVGFSGLWERSQPERLRDETSYPRYESVVSSKSQVPIGLALLRQRSDVLDAAANRCSAPCRPSVSSAGYQTTSDGPRGRAPHTRVGRTVGRRAGDQCWRP